MGAHWTGSKTSFTAYEKSKPASKSPRVDDLLSCLPANSPRAHVELCQLARKLEDELTQEKKRNENLQVIIEKLNQDKKKVLCEASMVSTKKKVSSVSTAFDNLSNDEVMERLKQFGF